MLYLYHILKTILSNNANKIITTLFNLHVSENTIDLKNAPVLNAMNIWKTRCAYKKWAAPFINMCFPLIAAVVLKTLEMDTIYTGCP